MLNNLGLGINVDVNGNAEGVFGNLGKLFGDFKGLLPPSVQQFGSLAGKIGLVAGAAYAAYEGIKFLYNGLDACTKSAGEFEYNMAYVSTIISKEQMPLLDGLGKSALDMSVKYGKSVQDMSRSMYQAISAGISPEDVNRFLEISGTLAVGGAASMEKVVDVLSSVKNAYNMSMDEMKQATSDMFVAVKIGKTEVPELAASLGNVIPIAAQLGVNFKEVSAMVASLTQQGIKTPEAITGIRQAMVSYMRMSPQFVEAAQQSGIKLDKATVNGMGFSKWLIYATDKMKAAHVNINKMFPEVEGLNAVLALTGKVGAKTAADALKEMASGSGAAQEAFEKMTDTLTFKQAQSDAAWERFKVKMGNVFLPIRKAWTDFKTDLFVGMGDAIGYFNPFIDTVRDLGSSISTAFSALISDMSPLLDFAGVIIKGVINAYMTFYTTIFKTIAFVANIYTTLSSVIANIKNKFTEGFQPIGNVFTNLSAKSDDWFNKLASKSSVISDLKDEFGGLDKEFGKMMDWIGGAIDAAINAVGLGIQALPDLVSEAFATVAHLVIDGMTYIAEKGLEIVEPIWKLMEKSGAADKGSFEEAKKSVQDWKTGKYASIEDTAGSIRGTMTDLMKDAVQTGMTARDDDREKKGKDKPPQVNVDTTVNVGNKKVHDSQRDWEEEFLLRNFVPVR